MNRTKVNVFPNNGDAEDYYNQSIHFQLETKKLSTYEIEKLNHPFLKLLPKHLYKYRKSGDEGRIDFYVGKRNIYTPSFNKMNDVFEGITPATKQRIMTFSAEQMCHFYKDTIIELLNEKFGHLDAGVSNQIFNIIIEQHFDNDEIYKKIYPLVNKSERKQLKRVVSALDYIFKGLEEKMNKNTNFSKGMKMLMNINEIMGAYCLCDSYANENLWALYADNYSGYCIEYDLTEPCKSKGSIRFITSLFPVMYVEKKDDDWFKPLFESTIKTIDINGNASKFDSGLAFHRWTLKTLCSKQLKWSSEREWRALGKANSSYLGPLVSSIIVGHNISKQDFSNIQRQSEKNGFPLKITEIDYINMRVLVRDIESTDIDRIMSK